MNTPLTNTRATLASLGQAGQTLWRSRSPRERLGLTLAASLIALALLWQIGLAPALRTWQEAPTRQATLDAQRERLLQLQQQAQALQALQALPRVGQEEALRWLQGPAIEALGPGAQVRVQGDQVQVQLQAASPEGLTRWLRQAREQARALPQQVQLQQAALPTAGSATTSSSASATAAQKAPAVSRPAGAAAATGGLAWKGSLVLKLS